MSKEESSGTKPSMVRLEPELSRRLEAVASKSQSNNSAVLRAALKATLAMFEERPDLVRKLEAGLADDISFRYSTDALNDPELDADITRHAGLQKRRREMLILEALRIGFPAACARWAYRHPSNAPPLSEEQVAHLFAYDPEAMPLARDLMGEKIKNRLQIQLINQMFEFPGVENLYLAIHAAMRKRAKAGQDVGVASVPLLFPMEEIEQELAALDSNSPFLKAPAKSAKKKSGSKK